VDRVTTLPVGGSEPLRIACSTSSPEVSTLKLEGAGASDRPDLLSYADGLETTSPEWELGFRLLDGREEPDAAICAFRASLTTRSTNRLPTTAMRQPTCALLSRSA